MAGLFSPDSAGTFRLLDPGAGAGSLAAAVCDQFATATPSRRLEIHLFENDAAVLPFLRASLEHCRNSLMGLGHEMTYVIHEADFIVDAAARVFGEPSLFEEGTILPSFDGVIMNPPYFKLSKDSLPSRIMRDVVHGQPNIYAFFLAAAAQMLRPDGELVAITPRSFCNGLYFREFRQWFFGRMALDHIHLFESRTDTFRDVLQESVVTLAHRLGTASNSLTISSSRGPTISHAMDKRVLPVNEVIDWSDGDYVVKIPASREDSEIASVVESWPKRFSDHGLRVSTGPVVTFRAREFLVSEPNGSDTAPLLSVHNVHAFRTVWPSLQTKHPKAFRVCEESQRHLLPAMNYVLLRRFSAKEEQRRLTASCYFPSTGAGRWVALENHLNYVYHRDRELTVDEAFGLAALFNSNLLDRYFRIISGNTQVNATELRVLKFPDLKTVSHIGSRVRDALDTGQVGIERIVLGELKIDRTVADHLLAGMLF